MATITDSKHSFYVVNDTTDDVTLTLLFGDIGVTVNSTILLDGTVLLNQKGNLTNYSIGKNADLAGKILSIYSMISATSGATYTEAKLYLNGGVIPEQYPPFHDNANPNDNAIYHYVIKLTN
ncbi:MAG: hypothetical protein LBE82_09905 [Chitinophagaceae bacterium]|jgi:hypothetical protein|nr:hypothetical protein [Chitinophagaceae bacterium]